MIIITDFVNHQLIYKTGGKETIIFLFPLDYNTTNKYC
jgi:hypothetical protein